jgi:hypothetical protein
MEDSNKNSNSKNDSNQEGVNEKLIEDMGKMLNSSMTFNRKKKYDEEEIKNKVRKFWGTQPVPQFQGESITENDIGPIDSNCDVKKEQKEPYNLPKGYMWYDVDIHNPVEITKVKLFLNSS